MTATTALRKIAKLKKRIRVIQGGQGAGKTYAILMLLINHAYSNESKEIYICSAELTKMRLTVIKDFIKIMRTFGVYNENYFIGGTLYKFPNNSTIKFIGLDKEDIGKGLRSDVVFVNECNKIDFETYRELTARAKNVFLDYNPNRKFWVHSEILERQQADFLNLTFNDNEFISETERKIILESFDKGYDENGNVINKYWANKWRVYGLGELGQIDGCVFQTFDEVDEIPTHCTFLGYGMDFGYTNPATLIAVYEDENNYYADEIIYQSQLKEQQLINLMKSRGVEVNADIVADSAEPGKIEAIAEHFPYIVGVNKKKSIKYGLELILEKNLIITKRSENLKNELQGLTWELKEADHAIDGLRYVILTKHKEKNNGRYVIG